MAWNDIVDSWRGYIPVEERARKVLNVAENFFEKVEWKSGTHVKITDNRLFYYKKKINPDDRNVAPDGSFQVIVKNKMVIKIYIKRMLHMIEIIEAYERTKK